MIGRWRGYRSASFVAFLEDGTAVAESPLFRSRGSAPPKQSTTATSAYDALEAELLRRGWEREPDGLTPDTWFARGFVRELDVFPARVDREGPEQARLMPQAPEPAYAHAAVEAPPQQAAPTEVREQSLVPVKATVPVETNAPRRSLRRARIGALVGLAVVVSGAVFLGVGHGLRHDRQIARAASAVPAVVPVRRAPVPAVVPVHRAPVTHSMPRRAQPAPPRILHVAPVVSMVQLRVSAPTRSSWFEVHRGSAQGRILFAGELSVGRTLRLRAPRLWVRFAAAGNLSITANGRRIPLQGTIEHTFVPSG